MTKILHSKVELPFSKYQWVWSGHINREVFNTPSVWLAILRKLRKYEGYPYSLKHESGKSLHSEIESLKLVGPDNELLSIVSGGDDEEGARSFLRGYAVYWTTLGVIVPFDKTNSHIKLTKLGHLVASGAISYKEFSKHIIKKLQYPNPLTNNNYLPEWFESEIKIKPLSFLLSVYIELFRIGGLGESYLTESETAVIVVPMSAVYSPSDIAQEVINWRKGEADLSLYYTSFLSTSHEYRNIKEHLQFLSSSGHLLLSEMMQQSLSYNKTDGLKAEETTCNCYFLNILSQTKYEQHSTSNDMLGKVATIIDESNEIGFFDFADSTEDQTLKYCEEYLGYYDHRVIDQPNIELDVDEYINILEKHKQIILYGPPGTGKTMYANAIADELARRNSLGEKISMQFHQGISYEDFIEGIRPGVDSSSGLSYEYKDGLFKSLINEAIDNPEKYYVAIIDEINRANIASVFGELIFLLEDAYRFSQFAITLPYTRDPFYIPQNVLIVGTMNSTDRGATEIDIALRRRFRFLKTPVDYSAIKNFLDAQTVDQSYSDDDGKLINVDKALQALNKIIIEDSSLGEDYCIGHSFFLVAEEQPYRETLLDIMNQSILPLLEEYLLLSIDLSEALFALGLPVKGNGINQIDLETMEKMLKILESS